MNYRQSIAYLESFKRYGIRLGLDRIRQLLSSLGDPQNNFRSIHIAGTNGKGSVAAMLSSILTRAGFKVGLYTSPHLVDYTERVRINEKDVSKAKFALAVEKVKKVIDKLPDMGLTEFEVLTAASFLLMAQEKVEIAVIEVGLGGRMDATNVITPILSIITNIERDHMDILGNSITKIAKEKAGIIKPGVPLVTGEKKLWRLLHYICKRQGCSMSGTGGIEVEFVPLPGRHQVENTRIVLKSVQVLRKLGFRISKSQLDKGLRSTRWPGRIQVVSKKPLMILDGAHNVAGANALVEYLKVYHKKFTFIVGMQKNKEIRKFVKILKPLADRFIVVQSSNPFAASNKFVAGQVAACGGKTVVAADIKRALSSAKSCGSPVCVTGSLYLVGDVLRSTCQII